MWNRRFSVNPNESVEQAVKRELNQIPVSSPIVDGRIIENINIPLAWNQIEHGLGRVPKGAIIIWNNWGGGITVVNNNYAGPGGYEPDDTYLYVYVSVPNANHRISLWVF